jgi:hypothetical protein
LSWEDTVADITVGGFEPSSGTIGEADGLLVGNIVLSPDARKIPPPTRLGLMLSRIFLASLNVCGCSDLGEGPEGVGIEFTTGVGGDREGVEDSGTGGCLSEREEIGLRLSDSKAESMGCSVFSGPGGTGAGVGAPFGWTTVIGTLRLFGLGGDGETGGLINNDIRPRTLNQWTADLDSLLILLIYDLRQLLFYRHIGWLSLQSFHKI